MILALVAQILADSAELGGAAERLARSGIPLAAILMSAGFFVSSVGRGRTSPNALIVLLWAGATSLAAGSVALGIGLLTA
jgi:hypothetical protein